LQFTRATPTGTTEDRAQFKLDMIKVTDGAADNAWLPADFTAVGAALDNFITAYKPYMAASHTYAELRSYRMRFNPADPGPEGLPAIPPKPFQETGGPVYVLARAVVGTAPGITQYQCAATVTMRTGLPKHWGRIYLPGFAGALDAFGRIGPASRTAIANGMFDLQDELQAAGFLLVIPMTQLSKRRFHTLLGVHQVVVDDIPDVVRRRRPKRALARTVGVE
jgi:hypothetical protein